MTDKELMGNLSLESLITWCDTHHVPTGLNDEKVAAARAYPLMGMTTFGQF